MGLLEYEMTSLGIEYHAMALMRRAMHESDLFPTWPVNPEGLLGQSAEAVTGAEEVPPYLSC